MKRRSKPIIEAFYKQAKLIQVSPQLNDDTPVPEFMLERIRKLLAKTGLPKNKD